MVEIEKDLSMFRNSVNGVRDQNVEPPARYQNIYDLRGCRSLVSLDFRHRRRLKTIH